MRASRKTDAGQLGVFDRVEVNDGREWGLLTDPSLSPVSRARTTRQLPPAWRRCQPQGRGVAMAKARPSRGRERQVHLQEGESRRRKKLRQPLRILFELPSPRPISSLPPVRRPIPASPHPPRWRTITAWSFAFPLRLWQRPHSPPTYRCIGTSPRNCWTTSIAWATPVAPRGGPHPRSPPRVLIGRVPPIRDWPSSMNLPPFPFSHRPRSSYSMISEIVKQSWVSATSTSWIVIPAIDRASQAAVFSGYQVVRLFRFPTREPLLA